MATRFFLAAPNRLYVNQGQLAQGHWVTKFASYVAINPIDPSGVGFITLVARKFQHYPITLVWPSLPFSARA